MSHFSKGATEAVLPNASNTSLRGLQLSCACDKPSSRLNCVDLDVFVFLDCCADYLDCYIFVDYLDVHVASSTSTATRSLRPRARAAVAAAAATTQQQQQQQQTHTRALAAVNGGN
jgi:hypothetical protein